MDYAYVLKVGGRLYTITDVEELHKWHQEMLESSPMFKRIPNEEIVNLQIFINLNRKMIYFWIV